MEILKEVIINISPRQLWNPDETIYGWHSSRIRVLRERGTATHRATSGRGEGNITIFMAADADGEKLPPLIAAYSKPDVSAYTGIYQMRCTAYKFAPDNGLI